MTAAIDGHVRLERNLDYRGEPVLAAGRPLGYGGWGLVAKMDEREAYAPFTNARRGSLVLAAAIGALGLAGAYSIARGFTRPLRRLGRAAEAVARGDLDVSVSVRSRNEFGALSAAFNDMVAALRVRTAEREQAVEAVHQSEALLRSIVDHTEDIIFVKDRESRTIFMNPAGFRVNELPPEKVLGRTVAEFVADPAQAAKFLADDRRVMESRRTETNEDILTSSTGVRHVLLTTKTPRFDAAGNVIGLVGVSHDITERKRAEAALEAERSRLRALIDVLPVSIYVKDTHSRFLVANNECARALGAKNPDELIGRTDADFFPAAIAAAFREDELKVLAGEAIVNMEEDSVHPDGSARTELTTKVPLRDGAGEIVGLVGVSRDITERKRADEAVRASETLLRSITDHTEDIIFVKDRDSRTLFMNPAGFRANALPPEKLLGHSDAEFIDDPVQAALFLANDRRVMDSALTETVEEVLTSATGEKHVLLTTKAPRFDADGKVIGLVGVARDITEQKAAEKALRESEQRLRTIIEAEPECVKIVSPMGRLLEMNPAGLAMLDAATLEDLSGQPLLNFVAPEHRPAFRDLHRQVMDGNPGTLEFETIGIKGTRRWLETHAVPLRDAAGQVTALLGVTRDITERKRAEDEIKASLAEKEVLLREVHHRVKNNLQIVSSLLNLQSRQLTDPALIEVFSSTRDRVRAMAAVHERLYESGDFARIDLAAHLTSLARVLIRAHSPAGSRVRPILRLESATVDLNTAVPLSLIANELILNALKYAFAGRADGTLTIELRAADGHHELLVADDGPGFPAALDPATTRTLGLRLVRDLARQISGELRIDTSASGTNFVIRWPEQLAATERVAPAVEPGSPEI